MTRSMLTAATACMMAIGVCHATDVSGTVPASTWTASGSPYRVTGTITVPAGNTLTIEAGVDVLFDADVAFIVEGALRVHGTETDSVRFLKGTAAEWGGIRISGGDSSSFTYARISDGKAQGSGPDGNGGGLHCVGSGTRLRLDQCRVSNNAAATWGGGLYSGDSSVVWLQNCTFRSNVASSGGGIASYGSSSLMASTCALTDNEAEYGGGLFSRADATAELIGCTLRSNDATDSGGAVFNYDRAHVLLGSCTICENVSHGSGGGGVRNFAASAVLRTCLLSGNRAPIYGGAIDNVSSASIDVSGCTIAGNSAQNGGGIHSYDDVAASVSSSILYSNGTSQIDADQSALTVSHSCIQGGIPEGVADGGGNISSDPLFSTNPDSAYHLTAGSPCIGTGTDGSDMGAFPFAGRISGLLNTATWTAESSPHRISAPCTLVAGATLTIEAGVDVLFDADVAFIVEGALRVHGTETDSVRFLKGTAAEWGGIRISGGDSSSFTYARISDGHADGGSLDGAGGGVCCSGPDTRLTMNHCTVSNNVAEGGGGGVCNSDSGAVMLTDCMISGNSASGGGGLLNSYSSSMALKGCLVTGNTAYSGGGVANEAGILMFRAASSRRARSQSGGSGTVTLTKCILTGNSASFGGAIINWSTATLTNCTLGGNSATEYGGGLCNYTGTATLENCILWGDSPHEIARMGVFSGGSVFYGTITVSHSCIQGGIPEGVADGGGNVSSDPLFSTNPDSAYHLTAGSPCIDAGGVSSDLDPDGAVADMGAYYFHQEPVSVASTRPVVLHLDQNAPNPFNPVTTLRFGLPEAGEVQLVVYDMLGRPVRTLFAGAAQAGEHSLVWDGTDDAGRALASGVYLYRLQTADGTRVRKMTLVR